MGNENDKYSKLNYKIEKWVQTEDSSFKNTDLLTKDNTRIYVLHNIETGIRFGYISSNHYKIGEIINGETLYFKRIKKNVTYNLRQFKNNSNRIYYRVFSKPKNNRNKKNDVDFTLVHTFFTKGGKDDAQYLANTLKIHQKKICFDNFNWSRDILNNMQIQKLQKKFFNELMQDSEFDEKIKKVLISNLFILDEYRQMIYNDHSIILSQGGTGKSSLLGVIGESLEDVSTAGIFGYSDIKKGMWQSGKIMQTKNPILIDEINEIIKDKKGKDDKVLGKVNTALEQGKFNSGKALGNKLTFANKFIFMGNCGDSLNFEEFLYSTFSNTDTCGRRFGYVIYDDKLFFKFGNKMRPTEPSTFIRVLRQFCSEILSYYMSKNFINLRINDVRIQNLVNNYNKIIDTKIKNMELENSRNFFFAFKKSSKRIGLMALKLTIFENLNKYLYEQNFKKINNSLIVEEWKKNFKELYEDIFTAMDNINNHLQNGNSNSKNLQLREKKLLESLGKYRKNLIKKIIEHENDFKEHKLYWEDIKDKGDLKYWKDNLIRKNSSLEKEKKILIEFGINLIMNKDNDIFFNIVNKFKLKEINDLIENDLINNPSKDNVEVINEIGEDLN